MQWKDGINQGSLPKTVNRSVATLRAWDKQGKLQPKRLPGGHRYYSDEDLLKALNIERKPIDTQTLIYGRASSPKQRKHLERQIKADESFCLANGWKIDRTMPEIGGGLNYLRPMFLELISLVEQRRLNRVVIAHRDRLCRFWFDNFIAFLQVAWLRASRDEFFRIIAPSMLPENKCPAVD